MPRTTVDIDASILRRLKRLARAERKSLGRLISELVALALDVRREDAPPPKLVWTSRPMGAKVDLDDKESVYALLEEA